MSFAPLLLDASAPSRRTEQYYEVWSNRAFYREGGLARSLQKRGDPINLDNWTLHHLDSDFSESRDVAAQHPEKLEELKRAFDEAAWSHFVYPLDNRDRKGKFTDGPPEEAARWDRPRTFLPGAQTVHRADLFPLIANRSYRIAVDFVQRADDAGVLWAIGEPNGGIVMWIENQRLMLHYNAFGDRQTVTGPMLAPGDHVAVFDYEVQAASRGRGRMVLDGAQAGGFTDMSPPMVPYGIFEGLDVGLDRRGPVLWDLYDRHGSFAYSGAIGEVTIEPGARLAG
jgi:arylsulfatase